MVKTSTSINQMNNYLSPQIINFNKDTTWGMGNTALGLEWAHKCGGIDQLISQLTTDT